MYLHQLVEDKENRADFRMAAIHCSISPFESNLYSAYDNILEIFPWWCVNKIQEQRKIQRQLFLNSNLFYCVDSASKNTISDLLFIIVVMPYEWISKEFQLFFLHICYVQTPGGACYFPSNLHFHFVNIVKFPAVSYSIKGINVSQGGIIRPTQEWSFIVKTLPFQNIHDCDWQNQTRAPVNSNYFPYPPPSL